MKIFLKILVVMLIACKSKQKQHETVPAEGEAKQPVAQMLVPVNVTADVSSLLPVPNSFQLKEAQKWNDQLGENWLLLYETGVFGNKKMQTSSAKLSAVLYLKTDTGFVQQWTLNDFVNECEVDVVCEFYKNHLSVTDLNKNGIAEVVMVYALSCRGDVSPNEKKLILYEGKQKYALRGTELMILQKDTIGGSITADAKFAELSSEIQQFAKNHWQKFGLQKYN
jgi:hypothetical protein